MMFVSYLELKTSVNIFVRKIIVIIVIMIINKIKPFLLLNLKFSDFLILKAPNAHLFRNPPLLSLSFCDIIFTPKVLKIKYNKNYRHMSL